VAFYPNFWLAVAAAAPVIALAGVVGITELLKRLTHLADIGDASGKSWRSFGGRFYRVAFLAYSLFVLNAFSLFIQAIAMGCALASLAYNNNWVSPVLMLFVLPAGIVVVLISVVGIVIVRALVGDVEEELTGGSEDTQAVRPSPKTTPQSDETTSHSGDATPPRAASLDQSHRQVGG
jgi:hypothetical protein